LIAKYPRWKEPDVSQAMVTAVIDRAVRGSLPGLELTGKSTGLSNTGGIHTQCAGVFLLGRAILDSRIAPIAKSLCYPVFADPVPALLASLALRWAGQGGSNGGVLDPAVVALAGLATATTDDLRQSWADTAAADHTRFGLSLLKILAAHRVFDGTKL